METYTEPPKKKRKHVAGDVNELEDMRKKVKSLEVQLDDVHSALTAHSSSITSIANTFTAYREGFIIHKSPELMRHCVTRM